MSVAFIGDAGNDTCTYSYLPIGHTEEYHTFQSWDYVSPFTNVSSSGLDAPSWLGNPKLKTEIYDPYVTQSVPFIVAAQFGGGAQNEPRSDFQVVCITPNNVTAGSRTTENRAPWTVAPTGSALQLGGASALAFLVIGVTSLTTML